MALDNRLLHFAAEYANPQLCRALTVNSSEADGSFVRVGIEIYLCLSCLLSLSLGWASWVLWMAQSPSSASMASWTSRGGGGIRKCHGQTNLSALNIVPMLGAILLCWATAGDVNPTCTSSRTTYRVCWIVLLYDWFFFSYRCLKLLILVAIFLTELAIIWAWGWYVTEDDSTCCTYSWASFVWVCGSEHGWVAESTTTSLYKCRASDASEFFSLLYTVLREWVNIALRRFSAQSWQYRDRRKLEFAIMPYSYQMTSMVLNIAQ